MSDMVEKIYCCDKGGSNNDALYALLANQNKGMDPTAMAMMGNGGMGGQWNNPLA